MFPVGVCKMYGNGTLISRLLSVCGVYSKSGGTYKELCSNPYIYQVIRNYAFKSNLKIKWVRPPKIPCIKPEKSGDLVPLPPVDKKQYPLEFQNSDELKTADDLVKRVFTLEFFPRIHSFRILKYDLLNSVRRHALDMGSPESKRFHSIVDGESGLQQCDAVSVGVLEELFASISVARMTADIRYMQEIMEQFPKDKRRKVKLKELIEHRRKCLKFLRKWDYRRFEWLLEKLDLVYKPPPSVSHMVTRKDSLRKLTDKYCEEVKQQRRDAYRASLEAQQMDFLRTKMQKLQWILKEEVECGVKPTVTEADIEQVLKQLKELELCNENRLKDKAG